MKQFGKFFDKLVAPKCNKNIFLVTLPIHTTFVEWLYPCGKHPRDVDVKIL